MYLAHSRNQFGETEPLSLHLSRVAKLAEEYASAFGAGQEACLAGLLHDLGKYGDLFQKRLAGEERGIDHWTTGAWTALTNYHEKGIAAALAIQGHHLGLTQASKAALGNLNPLRTGVASHGLRLSETSVPVLLARFREDGFQLPEPGGLAPSLYAGAQGPPAAAMLDTRMLFSALVDADFIATEAHFDAPSPGMAAQRQAAPQLRPREALDALLKHVSKVAAGSASSPNVRHLRGDLLDACLGAAEVPQGLFTLTAPTGAGKTLAMLAFALKHAARHDLRRVIVVIPYLSIIEQTVKQYLEAFAKWPGPEELSGFLIEDHSLTGLHNDEHGQPDTDLDTESARIRAEVIQNWDAPIIVTTSVQFLESIFTNRASASRKLHRIAQSVVLFDEVQTLPLALAIPTLATLSRLAERYQSSVVFSTATQPAFTHLDEGVRKFCRAGWTPREIVAEDLDLFARARRTAVRWPLLNNHVSWEDVAEQLAAYGQVLCIVNLKRHAIRLFELLREIGGDGLYHLSTNMCLAHRRAKLNEVRNRLLAGETCRLVATQCVEAGVDLDFPVVYRAFGPLDAIAQAAGRCNRNGHARLGEVHVFLPEDEKYPDGTYQQATVVARSLISGFPDGEADIHDPDLFKRYYRDLYQIAEPDKCKPMLSEAILRQDFAEVGTEYRVIEKNAVNVLVPYEEATYHQLADEVRRTGLSAGWTKRARPTTISLFRPALDDPVREFLDPVPLRGRAFREYAEDWFIYLGAKDYDPDVGLITPPSSTCTIA